MYDREEYAFDSVAKGEIDEGDVVVIRYEGPKGGPGMREMLATTAALVGQGLVKKWQWLLMVDFQEGQEDSW